MLRSTYQAETEPELNKLRLGEISGLSYDAKMLIYLNPKLISRLAVILNDHADEDVIRLAIVTK